MSFFMTVKKTKMTLFVILQITVRLTLKMNYAVHEVHSVYALYLKRFCSKMKGKAKTCLKAIKVSPSAKSIIMKPTICKGSEGVIKERKPARKSKSGSQCAAMRRTPVGGKREAKQFSAYKYIFHNVVCDLLSLIGVTKGECAVPFLTNPYVNMGLYVVYYWAALIAMLIPYKVIYMFPIYTHRYFNA
ncbi:unnamed protein product [Brugia timori]|uniref:Receptor expression-enhancing protein n=1 Tax=Brugia timori TaxID=42155 RepID=A0A0R3QWV4_9BILA|nr:unnamed protein product [Brugia timori]